VEKFSVAAVSTRNWIADPERSIENLANWARKAAAQGARFVVFPELSVSGYFHSQRVWDAAEPIPGPSVERMIGVARTAGAVLCFGLLERDADIVYNTQVIVDGDGVLGAQRKIHMPGTEYLHWRGGFEAHVIDIGAARVGVAICYDALYSEWARTLFLKGAEVLVMPFACNPGPVSRGRFPDEHIHAMTYRSHCYCNGAYGIVANLAGSTAGAGDGGSDVRFPGWAGVFGPRGEVVAWARDEGNDEAMVVAELDPEQTAAARRDMYFLPRCLRPDAYASLDPRS